MDYTETAYSNFTWSLDNVGRVEVTVQLDGEGAYSNLDEVVDQYEQPVFLTPAQSNELVEYAETLFC